MEGLEVTWGVGDILRHRDETASCRTPQGRPLCRRMGMGTGKDEGKYDCHSGQGYVVVTGALQLWTRRQGRHCR